ncbi:unnamed protein product [Owenia fusiformis]|nr:unnamed protein product [Owenia fusiformis]
MRKESVVIITFLSVCCIVLINKQLFQDNMINAPEMLLKQSNERTQSTYLTGVSKGVYNDAIDNNAGNFKAAKDTSGGNTNVTHNETQYKCQPTDSNRTCQPLEFSERLLPMTALYSFPGSGNTWARHLIQQITGIYTGSMFDDIDLKKHGFPGEGRTDGHVVVIKTHDVSTFEYYQRVIIIIRNPFDAFLADFKRLMNKEEHVGEITEDEFKEKNMITPFSKFMATGLYSANRIDDWFLGLLLALKAFSTKNTSLILHYENLKTNLRHELLRIGDFLGFSISADIIQCTICNSEGNYHRKSKGFFNPYSKQETIEISSYIKALNETFKERCGRSCAFPYSTPSLTELL